MKESGTDMVDAMLVERAAGGNIDAFGQIYEIIYPKAVKYVESMSKDAGAAEQVVQDTVVYFMQDNCKALYSLSQIGQKKVQVRASFAAKVL